MDAPAPADRRKLLFRVGLALVVLAALGLFLVKGVHFFALVDRLISGVTSLGPWAFFTAMALLPAVGAPTLAFTLIAGTAFAPQMGMANVVWAGMAASVINLAITYWLARWVIRRWLGLLLVKLGYPLPQVDESDSTDLIVILRVTPGVPFCIQNYLLGLAEVPAGRYFLISCLAALPQTAACIVFGDALRHGKSRMILVAVCLIVALVAATHFLRRHYGQKKMPA